MGRTNMNTEQQIDYILKTKGCPPLFNIRKPYVNRGITIMGCSDCCLNPFCIIKAETRDLTIGYIQETALKVREHNYNIDELLIKELL